MWNHVESGDLMKRYIVLAIQLAIDRLIGRVLTLLPIKRWKKFVWKHEISSEAERGRRGSERQKGEEREREKAVLCATWKSNYLVRSRKAEIPKREETFGNYPRKPNAWPEFTGLPRSFTMHPFFLPFSSMASKARDILNRSNTCVRRFVRKQRNLARHCYEQRNIRRNTSEKLIRLRMFVHTWKNRT